MLIMEADETCNVVLMMVHLVRCKAMNRGTAAAKAVCCGSANQTEDKMGSSP